MDPDADPLLEFLPASEAKRLVTYLSAVRPGRATAGQPWQDVAVTYNGQDFAFDLFDLRAVDIANSDDMLRCLDAPRWARADLNPHVPDGDVRVLAGDRPVGLRWPCAD
ncbi:MAG TPA: hypothetical protein VIM34_16600 [Burkholderiaceae bacterium]